MQKACGKGIDDKVPSRGAQDVGHVLGYLIHCMAGDVAADLLFDHVHQGLVQFIGEWFPGRANGISDLDGELPLDG